MNPKSTHLLLVYDEQVPPEIVDEFCRSVEVRHLEFRRQSLPKSTPNLVAAPYQIFLAGAQGDGLSPSRNRVRFNRNLTCSRPSDPPVARDAYRWAGIATGRSGDPVAPRSFRGAAMNRNSYT